MPAIPISGRSTPICRLSAIGCAQRRPHRTPQKPIPASPWRTTSGPNSLSPQPMARGQWPLASSCASRRRVPSRGMSFPSAAASVSPPALHDGMRACSRHWPQKMSPPGERAISSAPRPTGRRCDSIATTSWCSPRRIPPSRVDGPGLPSLPPRSPMSSWMTLARAILPFQATRRRRRHRPHLR